MRNLRLLVAEERRQLEADLARKLEELEEMKRRHREEEARLQREVAMLTEKMDSLEIPPTLLSTNARRGNILRLFRVRVHQRSRTPLELPISSVCDW